MDSEAGKSDIHAPAALVRTGHLGVIGLIEARANVREMADRAGLCSNSQQSTSNPSKATATNGYSIEFIEEMMVADRAGLCSNSKQSTLKPPKLTAINDYRPESIEETILSDRSALCSNSLYETLEEWEAELKAADFEELDL